MKQKNIISLLTGLLLLSGCVKDVKFYKITGKLFVDCNNVPITKQTLELWQQKETGNEKATLSTATTDANGNFSFTYQVDNDNNTLSIKSSASVGHYTYMENIPQRENIDGLIVYQNASTTIKVKLEVYKTYLSTDTLFYGDLRTNSISFLVGPFSSGDLYVATNAVPVSSLDYRYNLMYFKLGYKVNRANDYTIKSFSSKTCDASEVVFEIK